ncbi:MAG: hypothetical protein NVS2B3_13270 [Vulcanimicrobiaceae bacterium]
MLPFDGAGLTIDVRGSSIAFGDTAFAGAGAAIFRRSSTIVGRHGAREGRFELLAVARHRLATPFRFFCRAVAAIGFFVASIARAIAFVGDPIAPIAGFVTDGRRSIARGAAIVASPRTFVSIVTPPGDVVSSVAGIVASPPDVVPLPRAIVSHPAVAVAHVARAIAFDRALAAFVGLVSREPFTYSIALRVRFRAGHNHIRVILRAVARRHDGRYTARLFVAQRRA